MYPISKEKKEQADNRAAEIVKEIYKRYPYCNIMFYIDNFMMYNFKIDFNYLGIVEHINIQIYFKELLDRLPNLLAKFIYERYIIIYLVRIKENNNA